MGVGVRIGGGGGSWVGGGGWVRNEKCKIVPSCICNGL